MKKEEFAQQIKLKYPQYASINDTELADAVVNKYPIYRTQIDEKSAFRKIADFFTSSSQKFGSTLGTAISTVDKETNENRDETLLLAQKQSKTYFDLAKKETDKVKKEKLIKASQTAIDNIRDIFGEEEYQKTGKQVFGEAFGTVLEIASAGTFGKAASKIPTIVKPLLSPAKTIAQGAKTGAKIGGTFGTGFGVSGAMQEDKSIGEIAKEGAISGGFGAVGGAVLGGGTSGLTQGAGALTSRVSKLQPIIKEKVGNAVYEKLVKISREITKMSPTASKNEAKWNKNTPKFLVDEGVISLVESDGKKLSTKSAIDALKTKYSAEAEAFSNVLEQSGEYISFDKLGQEALGATSNLKSRGSDYNKAIKYIQEEIASYKQNYRNVGVKQGDDLLVNVADFNRIKSGLWKRTSNFNPTQQDKLLSDLNYQMGQSAKGLIEDTISDAGIKRMNSRLGDFVSAMKVLENAEGKVIPGGFFGKQATRIAGTIAGASGGIPGSVIGNLTGGALAEIMMNPQIKTSALTKLLQKLGRTTEGANIIDDANKTLQKWGEERASRKLLESSKNIYAGSKSDTSKLFTQEEAKILMNELKIKLPPKLIQAPKGDTTNPFILPTNK